MKEKEVKFKLIEVDGKKVKKPKNSAQKQVLEFAKLMVMGIGIMIFIVVIFSMVMIWRTGVGLESLHNFMSVVGGAVIVGYCTKFIFENPAKIKKQGEQDIISTIQNYLPTLIPPSTIPQTVNTETESEK